jgi:hypothetical protein
LRPTGVEVCSEFVFSADHRLIVVGWSRMKRFVIILGIILLIGGVVGLVHPNFSYHKQEEVAKIGSFKATVDEEKSVQIPAAVSIVLLVSGMGLVLLGPRIK